jgi:hypothetical protein
MHRFIEESLQEVLKHASSGRRNAFRLTLLHIEATVSEVFTVRRIRRGWEKAGLLDLNYHTIMSHWLPWIHQDAYQIAGIEALFPAFFYEMANHGTLSDATMQSMQPYFTVDFRMFATDRSGLTPSRQRGMCVSIWLQAKNFVDKAAGIIRGSRKGAKLFAGAVGTTSTLLRDGPIIRKRKSTKECWQRKQVVQSLQKVDRLPFC